MQAPGVLVTANGTGLGWCVDEHGHLTSGGYIAPTKAGRRPKRVRCPNCGRRVVPRTIDYEPNAPQPCHPHGNLGEPGYTMPPHKVSRRQK